MVDVSGGRLPQVTVTFLFSAVEAAVTAQRALAGFRWPKDVAVRVRMGLHTAEPHLVADGYVGIGVHRAARICDAAHGGQILLSAATAGIVEDAELPGVELLDLGEHGLKGLLRPQRLFQVVVSGLPSRFARPRTPEAVTQVPGIGTFVACDLSGFGHVIRRLGDEATAAVTADYHAAVTAVVEANRGVPLELVGDTVVAVFRGASEAVRAAAAIREALAGFAWPPRCDLDVSVVVHSGRWSGDPRRPAAGTVFLRLARLGREVEPGQVLVSPTTAALLEGDSSAPALNDLGERKLRDFDEPIHIYEVAGPR